MDQSLSAHDLPPHQNPYLVATHQQFLLSQMGHGIHRSRQICQELRQELRQPRSAALTVSPTVPRVYRRRRVG